MMLPEWYFCCCIKADPDRTLTFLSILETFENRESDGKLLYLACEELQKTEIWMQIYALPYMLGLLQRNHLSTGVLNVAGNYLENLMKFISDDIRKPFSNLVDLILSGARSSQLMMQLKSCILETNLLPPTFPTDVPYLDLKDFLPETLILTVMNIGLTYDDEFAVSLSAKLDEDVTYQTFLQQALGYEFGRLSFRIANHIAYFAGGYSRDDLQSGIIENEFSTIGFEPDLLQTYAKISFLDTPLNGYKHQDPELAKSIVSESIRLSMLRDILKKSKVESTAPVMLIGLRMTKDRKTVLPIIYWQATLWGLAAEAGGKEIAPEFQHIWKPPVYNSSTGRFDVPKPIQISCKKEERNLCEDQYKSLMDILLPWRSRISIKSQKKFHLPRKYGWIFSTPWIWHHKYKWYDYPQSRRPEVLIRLMSGAFVSIRLLQQLPKDSPHRTDFCALIAHASSVLYQYRWWLWNYDEPDQLRDDNPRISLAITGLVLFSRRQIDLAGEGHFPSIPPYDFVKLLHQQIPADQQDRKSERYRFKKENLPQVLMAWIEDAYPGAFNSKGPGRWLDHIPDVYKFYQQKKKYYFPDQVKTALIGRFLCPEHSFSIKNNLDWRTAKYKGNKLQWKVGHRQLLLTERGLLPSEWYRPDWDESEVFSSIKLVRALERLATLGVEESRTVDVPVEVEQNWRSEWKDCLNRIEKSLELDRFIRLRLLEMLDHPATQDLEAQETILFVLLEYGSIYDLRDLFNRVFPMNGEWALAEVSDTRQRLQKTMVRALCRILHQQSTNTSNRFQFTVEDPRDQIICFRNIQFIREMLLKLSYLGWSANDELSNRVVNTLIEAQLHYIYKSSDNASLRIAEIAIEKSRSGDTHVILTKNSRVFDWSIRGVVYDLTGFSPKLFHEDIDTRNLVNLFDMPKNKRRAFRVNDSKTQYVLAVIVQVHGIDKNKLRFVFDCGLPFYISTTRDKDPDRYFRYGDYIRLPIQQDNDGFWFVPQRATIYHVRDRDRPGDVVELRVREYCTQSHNRYLEIKQGYRNLYGDVDLRVWDADVSRGFRKLEQPDRQVLARIDQNGNPIPLELDLETLLVNRLAQNDPKAIVLTFIDTCQGAFGEMAWRFSTQPGENYLLGRNDFTEDSAYALELKLDGLSNPFGLLVTVIPTIQNKQCRLRLIPNSPKSEDIDAFWPDLRIPFDERNIEWREVFDLSIDNETYIANRKKSHWYFQPEPPIPGYHTIKIFWDKFPHNRNSSKVEFRVNSWNERDQRSGQVHGEPPWLYKLTVKYWQEFLDDWLNIKQGDCLHLRKAVGLINPHRDGYISCLTKDNTIIQVEVESLTMRPVSPQEKIDIDVSGRMAEVIWCGWYKTNISPDIDPDQIPNQAIVNQSCLGILSEVPNRYEGTLCGVVWKINERIIHGKIQIDNLAEIRPRVTQGCQVRGYKQAEREWQFVIKVPRVRVRALWEIKKLSSYHDGLCYLGRGLYDGCERPVAESSPGELVILPESPSGVNHLAEYDIDGFQRIISSTWRTDNTAKIRSRYQRAILHLDKRLVIGNCKAGAPNKNVRVVDISIALNQGPDAMFTVRRRFELRAARTNRPQRKKKSEIESSNEIWNIVIKEYLESPQNLHGTFSKRGSEIGVQLNALHGEQVVKVPVDQKRTRWISWAKVAEDERTYVAGTHYNDEAFVRLFENSKGEIRGSFRRVPPLTPEEFKREIGVDFDIFARLENPLYYVGPEDFDEITGVQFDKVCHRFEMGYGQTILVPESKLQFNGEPFSQLELLIFHGDIVKGVTFLEDKANDESVKVNNEELQGSNIIINIESVNLRFSQARTLYSQRSDYKIVHILHLVPYNDHIEIRSVEGFDESRLMERRLFTRIQAELGEESQNRLIPRFQNWDSELEQTPQIMGRLDEQRFRETLGREIVFEHVRMSFLESKFGSPLLNNELVFFQAQNIFPLTNDIALKIVPPTFLNDNDVGDDMRSLLLLRRSFSVRQSLLKQIYEKRGSNGLSQDLLLIRVNKRKNMGHNNDQIYTSMVRRPPLRKSSALIGAVDRASLLLAAIARIENNKEIRIELQPGVFVRIKSENVEYMTEGLKKRDIVRVQVGNRPDGMFRIIRAAFTDFRYVPRGETRSVVVFPKNHFFNDDIWEKENVGNSHFWLRSKGFTIGGLPNIIPLPGNYDYKDNTWSPPQPDGFVKLMEKPHPKVACLGRDNRNLRIAPYTTDPVGRLELAENGISVKYIATLHERNWNKKTYWNFLSFGDDSIRNLIARANEEKWQYHDIETGRWTKDNSIELKRLSSHDIWTGPIFFEKHGGVLSLRYDESNFIHFGFPISELIKALRRKRDNRGQYPVAGISKSPEGGLWIELTPGRIVELPANLVVRRARNSLGYEPISNMHWENFAPGDLLDLELVLNDSISIERIVLTNWEPGPRKTLGPQKCILPIQNIDRENGSITVGDGEFILTLPFEPPNFNPQRVSLNPDNHIRYVDSAYSAIQQLQSGDVVLLGMSDRDTPILFGIEIACLKVRLHPDCDFDADEDVIFEAINPNRSEISLDWDKLTKVITAAGGALPMTVEKISEKEETVYLSMRYQRRAAKIPTGDISEAHVLGLLSDRLALLRCGSGLIKMRVDRIISGLPKVLYAAAIDIMKIKQVTVWLHRGEDGKLKGGLSDERGREIFVETLSAVSSEETHLEGLLCRSLESMNLFWLPSKYSAWADISLEHLESLFIRKDTFKARIVDKKKKSNFISVTHLSDVQKELSAIELGRELTVRVLNKISNASDFLHQYLVESFATGVIMNCEVYQDDPLRNDLKLPVEVSKLVTGNPPLVTVVPLGERLLSLNLPTWMTTQLPEPGKPREPLARYLKWQSEGVADEDSRDAEKIKEISDETLKRLLCHAYNSLEESLDNTSIQVRSAWEWAERIPSQSEINPAYSIMAALLLEKNGNRKIDDLNRSLVYIDDLNDVKSLAYDWRSTAYRLTRDLGKRALCSMHVEILAREWLLDVNNYSREDGLWRRLQRIRDYLITSHDIESIRTINRFCDAVDVQNHEGLLAISHSLAAATGYLSDISVLASKAEITSSLIKLYKTMPCDNAWYLSRHHVDQLTEILDKINFGALDITLLNPLPDIDKRDA